MADVIVKCVDLKIQFKR